MSASISCSERGERLLSAMLSGGSPDVALARSLARDGCSDALFRIVVEGLADRFESRLCDAYRDLFSEVLAEVFPEYDAAALRARYERNRVPRLCTRQPECVCVLSRVTLGADIAVASVLLAAAKARFPGARIVFVGSAKNAELWAADPRIEHVAAPYPRTGSFVDRLAASRALREAIPPGSVVLDPDSRLTQLGMLPVCEDERYFFFESRGYGQEGDLALPELAAEWCQRVLGAPGEPYLALANGSLREQRVSGAALTATVSFGVGENLAKRVDGAFEAGVLRALTQHSYRVLVDFGAGEDEAARVQCAIEQAGQASGVPVETWRGSFAGFAAQIAQSDLYVGYDSAGQHAAAALGVPLVTVFAGSVSARMSQRWKPTGRGAIAVVAAGEDTLRRTADAIERIRIS